jgi:hypothetical protein
MNFPIITDSKELLIDNTWKGSFDTCPAMYFMKRGMGYSSIYSSTALRYGLAWHKAMEGYYSSVRDVGWNEEENLRQAINYAKECWDKENERGTYIEDYRTLENLSSALLQYVTTFAEDLNMLSIVESERKFKIFMFEYNGISVYFTGKIDLEININDVFWNLDFKTTGWHVPQLIAELERSWQFIGYQFASSVEYSNTPQGTMLQIHKLLSRKLKAGGYGKLTIEHHRVPLIYGMSDIKRWLDSFVYTGRRIIHAVEKDQWIHNYSSCTTKFGRCGLWNLCQQENKLREKELGSDFIVRKPFNVLTD